MGDNQSFDATDFFASEPELPTILESDERPNIPTSTDSPLDTEQTMLNAEGSGSITAIISNGTPVTDKTAIEDMESTKESENITVTTYNGTPVTDKTANEGIGNRSNTPDISRVSRRKNREAASTPTGSRQTSRSRSNTPKRKNTAGFIQSENYENYEMKPLREPLTSANFVHLGVPGEINFPSANIRQLTIGVFHIFNPTEKQISWRLTPADNAMFRRLGTASNASIKVDDVIFKVIKEKGFLQPKHAERVDVHFCPLGVGSYMQTFVLEDASENGTNDVDSVSMKFQGVSTENTFSTLLQKHRPPKKEVKFEIEESEIKMPATRVGKQRSMGIKISNVSNESIRLNCKVDTSTGPGGKFVLSLPMNSVVIKPEGFAIIPVRFQPRAEGEVRGIVTIQAINNAEVKVDVIAKGILDNQQTSSITNNDTHS